MQKGMESRVTKQAREFVKYLYGDLNYTEDEQFEIFSACMVAIANSIKIMPDNKDSLKEIWLNANVSGIDSFFILADNSLYTINNYSILTEGSVKFKNVDFYFIESKNSNSVDSGALQKSFRSIKDILDGQNTENIAKIAECVKEINEMDIQNKTLNLKLYFCTKKTETDIKQLKDSWSDLIRASEEEISDYINISTIIIGSDFLRKTYDSTKDGVKIDIPKENLLDISEHCFVGYIKIEDIMKAISFEVDGNKTLRSNIFDDNIRLFLGDTNINKNIKETIKNSPEKFYLYNNGVTIISSKCNPSIKSYTFNSIKIINGCQTINSIFDLYSKENLDLSNIYLPIKIIEAIDEDEIELIATCANSQNQIDTYQLLSNREFFKSLQTMLNNSSIDKIFYKRRVGETDKEGYTNIDLLYIMRSLMSTIFQIPHKASGYFDSTMNKYLDNLNNLNQEQWCQIFYICTCLFIRVEKILKLEAKDTGLHLLRHHITFLFFRVIATDLYVKRPKIGDIPQINSEYMENLVQQIEYILTNTQLFETIFKEIVAEIQKTEYCNIKKNQKIAYSPMNKYISIDKIDKVCSSIHKKYVGKQQ